MSADRRERAERKLMAVLAADVVGYSRLMGADEEGTHERLKAVRRQITDPRIEEHRGRIVKTTGDGLLVEFASVVDSVRCAVEIQREMAARNREVADDRRIAFRIGINLGDIIIDDTDIFGDGVNVAARLEPLAEPGGICVSRVVRDQVRDKLSFGFEDLGQRQVKNIARPVHIFRVALDAGLEAATGAVIGGPAAPDRVSAATASAASRIGSRTVPRRTIALAGLAAGAALAGAAGVWSWTAGMRAAPQANPSPLIGAPVLFEKDGVAMIPSAVTTLAEQAKFLSDNPRVKAVIAASCARQERARDGAWVLAELRANRVRGELKGRGVAGDRMTIENACKADRSATLPAEVTQAQDGQVFVLWK
jgi:class 3 adenylate cyclase/outer membrane protein OmpA-like peptidoglycan-associated protein